MQWDYVLSAGVLVSGVVFTAGRASAAEETASQAVTLTQEEQRDRNNQAVRAQIVKDNPLVEAHAIQMSLPRTAPRDNGCLPRDVTVHDSLSLMVIDQPEFTNLSALAGQRVCDLRLSNTGVKDLGLLRTARIMNLSLEARHFIDLAPLRGHCFKRLELRGLSVETLETLPPLDAQTLVLDYCPVIPVAIISRMPQLRHLVVRHPRGRLPQLFDTPLPNLYLQTMELEGFFTTAEEVSAFLGKATVSELTLGGVRFRKDAAPLDFSRVSQIRLSGCGEVHLHGLSNWKGKKLSINNCSIAPKSAAAVVLVNLEELHLFNNGRTKDVSFAANFPALKKLTLGQMDVADVSFLAKCPKLEELTLFSLPVDSVTVLQHLPNLKRIELAQPHPTIGTMRCPRVSSYFSPPAQP